MIQGTFIRLSGCFIYKCLQLLSQLVVGLVVLIIFASEHGAWADASIEEIVVTARKREESLQDTPISITAFTSDEIEARQIDSVFQISESTPNLVFDNAAALSGSSAASSVFIRGVGQLDFTLNTDPGVGVYVDGVYLSRSIGGLVDLLDVERIEVLRGPQGTLFGKNTTGGAVNITTKKPGDELEGKVGITLGRYDRIKGFGSINIPVNDNLYNRTSIVVEKRDGFIKRLQDKADMGDVDGFVGRSSFLWNISPELEVSLAIDGTRKREGAAALVPLAIDGTGAPFGLLHNTMVVGALCTPPPGPVTEPACFNSQWQTGDAFETNAGFRSVSDLDLWGVAGTVSWDIGPLTLRSITAYRDMESTSSMDLDQSPHEVFDLLVDQNYDAVSEELQILGSGFDERLEWIVGFYYLREEGRHIETIRTSLFDFTSGGDTVNESAALYSQGTFALNSKLSITAGMRYTYDSRIFTPDTSVFASIFPPVSVGMRFLPNASFSTSANDFTPMVSVAYAWTDKLMTYFTYSEGFKSGGFTQRVATPQSSPPDFDPEFVTVYEAGFKFTGFDNRFRLNGSAFHSDYSDIQVLGNPPNTLGSQTVNAGQATIYGFELEATLLPVDELLIQTGIGYLHAQYDELLPFVTEVSLDNALPNTPKWSISNSVSYTIASRTGFEFTPRLDWFYRSSVANDASNEPVLVQKSYHLLNASLRMETPDRLWRLTLSGKNLSNETYLVTGEFTPGITTKYGVYALPRTWALTLERMF